MRIVNRLGREDWIAAGFEALEAGGAGAVAVQALARRLGVTKGSFYWHFRDRAALRDAMLDYWEHRMTAVLLRRAREGAGRAPGAGTRESTGPAPSVRVGPGGLPDTGMDGPPRGPAACAPAGESGARGSSVGAGGAGPGEGEAAGPGKGGQQAVDAARDGNAPARLLPALADWAREDAAVARRLAAVRAEAGRGGSGGAVPPEVRRAGAGR